MEKIEVTISMIRNAFKKQDWDLLDKLFEIDNKYINESGMFTDGWGEWNPILYEAVVHGYVDAVKICMKYGADPDKGSWGDCIPRTALEAADNKSEIKKIMLSGKTPVYVRKREPKIDTNQSKQDKRKNKLNKIAEETGLYFPDESDI